MLAAKASFQSVQNIRPIKPAAVGMSRNMRDERLDNRSAQKARVLQKVCLMRARVIRAEMRQIGMHERAVEALLDTHHASSRNFREQHVLGIAGRRSRQRNAEHRERNEQDHTPLVGNDARLDRRIEMPHIGKD